MSDPASLPTVGVEPSEVSTPPAKGAADVPRDPMIGLVIGDRYRLLARIGEGGMGAVYRSEHVLIKKVVALKLLHAELGSVDDAARRFEREALSASRLNHPHIIAVTDFGRAASGELFLVMEYIEGESLAARIEHEGAMPPRRALEIVREILLGLEHAHSQGVVHRDLKPANIMLARYADARMPEVVKILDFGIAKLTQGASEGERPLTQGAMVFGTPSYMSPEQATAQDADARADIYSCGVMLYELLTGRKPFVAEDVVKVMAMQVTHPPPPFAQSPAAADVPVAIEAAVMKALEKDRTRRHQSAAEFREALEHAAARGGGVWAARLKTAGTRALVAAHTAHGRLPWRVRRWTPLAGVAAVVVLLALAPRACHHEGAAPTAAPPPPRPVERAMEAPLRKIEDSIAAGRLPEGRMLLMQQVSQHPDNARVRFLLGNLEFGERNPAAGLAAYDEALRLDPGLRGDAALLLNARNTLPDKKHGRNALDLLVRRVGKPAAPLLAEVATDDRRPEFRAVARAACATLGCGDKVDLVRSYAQDLQQARTCEEKREAVQHLAETKDPRALDPLKRALRGSGGVLSRFLGGTGGCAHKEIQAAIKELGG